MLWQDLRSAVPDEEHKQQEQREEATRGAAA